MAIKKIKKAMAMACGGMSWHLITAQKGRPISRFPMRLTLPCLGHRVRITVHLVKHLKADPVSVSNCTTWRHDEKEWTREGNSAQHLLGEICEIYLSMSMCGWEHLGTMSTESTALFWWIDWYFGIDELTKALTRWRPGFKAMIRHDSTKDSKDASGSEKAAPTSLPRNDLGPHLLPLAPLESLGVNHHLFTTFSLRIDPLGKRATLATQDTNP